MIRTILVGAVLALGATAVLAQGDVVSQRKELMKEIGAAVRQPGAMLRGGQAFDLATVQNALRTIAADAQKAKGLFPESSKTGDTNVLPAAWERNGEFLGLFDKLERDAQTALNTIKDEATFKAEFPKVLQNCGACHQPFRKPTT